MLLLLNYLCATFHKRHFRQLFCPVDFSQLHLLLGKQEGGFPVFKILKKIKNEY